MALFCRPWFHASRVQFSVQSELGRKEVIRCHWHCRNSGSMSTAGDQMAAHLQQHSLRVGTAIHSPSAHTYRSTLGVASSPWQSSLYSQHHATSTPPLNPVSFIPHDFSRSKSEEPQPLSSSSSAEHGSLPAAAMSAPPQGPLLSQPARRSLIPAMNATTEGAEGVNLQRQLS